MGNKSSVATIAVSFDRMATVPGDVVTGKVFLSVSQSVVHCVSIGCRVIGQESTVVHYTTTSGTGENQKTDHHTELEAWNFVDFPMYLQQFPRGKVLAGHYEFPFQFTIPHGCPPSLVAGACSHCSVLYYVEVWLDRPKHFKWDVRNKHHFTVVSHPPTNTRTPIYMEPSTSKLRTMGLMSRGNVFIGGMVENSTLVAGQTTVVKYAVVNQSSLKLKAIEVSLEEIVNFRANSVRDMCTTKLFQKRITARDCPLDLSGLRGDPLDAGQALRAIKWVLHSDITKLRVTVPGIACSSYVGTLMSITHELVIRVCTPFGTSNPEVRRPVYVLSRSAPIVPHQDAGFAPPPALPVGWRPVVAQAVVFPTIARTAAVPYGKQLSPTAVAACRVVTVDPVAELNRFLMEGGDANALQDEDYYKLFASIRDVFDQQRAADVLATHLSSISCAKVGNAAAGANQMVRREVVEKLLSVEPLVDKQNAALVNKHLSAFEAMTVEKYFR